MTKIEKISVGKKREKAAEHKNWLTGNSTFGVTIVTNKGNVEMDVRAGNEKKAAEKASHKRITIFTRTR